MKSCLGLLITCLVFVAVVGGGALIWHLSDTVEFTRTTPAAATSSNRNAPPVAKPVPAQVHGKPPVAKPVR